MHQVSRHAVACFLTRGDLWISWEEGLKVRLISVYLTHCFNTAPFHTWSVWDRCEMQEIFKIWSVPSGSSRIISKILELLLWSTGSRSCTSFPPENFYNIWVHSSIIAALFPWQPKIENRQYHSDRSIKHFVTRQVICHPPLIRRGDPNPMIRCHSDQTRSHSNYPVAVIQNFKGWLQNSTIQMLVLQALLYCV